MKKILITLLLALPTNISHGQDISIVTEDFPPYNYMLNGKVTGLSTEVVQAVIKQANLKGVIKLYPWARSYRMAIYKKNHLIYSIARIPEREHLFHWVGVISPYRTSFFKLKERSDIKVSSLDQAKIYRIGSSTSDVNTIYLEKNGFKNLQKVTDDVQNIKKLKLGRVDMIVYEENSFIYQVKKLGLKPSLFEQIYRLEELTDNLYMALSKTSDLTLLSKLKADLEAIKQSGIYKNIHQAYSIDE